MQVVNMQVVATGNTKQVVYHDVTVTVDVDTVAIAADQDGEIWAYHNVPPVMFEDSFGLSDDVRSNCERIPYLEAKFSNEDEWKDSLVEYPLGEQS